jgi:hypothetical protein
MQARLLFQLADQADPVRHGISPYDAEGNPNLVVSAERMWVWIEALTGHGAGASAVGVLMNQPISTHSRLAPGARVRFRLTDVIDFETKPSVAMDEELEWARNHGLRLLDVDEVTAPENPHRDPTIDPGQAEVCARYNVRPHRPTPSPLVRCVIARSLTDGAWPVYGARGHPDPERADCGWTIWCDELDMSDAARLEVVALPEVWDRNRSAWNYLALPPGWAFVIGPDGHEDVYEDPELLSG